MVVHTCNSRTLERLRQTVSKFKTQPGNLVRPYFKNISNKTKQKVWINLHFCALNFWFS